MIELRIDEIITLVEYLENFIEAKYESCHNPRMNHSTLNSKRTTLVDYLEELFGEKKND